MNTDKIYAEQLANEYAPKNTSKVVALKKLDAKAKLPANIFTYTLGVISALVFGTGMCLAMGQIGSGTAASFAAGVIIGIIGMCGMILLMVLTDSGYAYHGYVIYLSAMYTFYAMIMSVVNLIRFRRLGSLILSAAKALNFVAALMSILGLQTAMIAQFSAGEKGFCRTMNALTGCGVWIAVIITAAYMLYRSKKIKRGDLI